jgi:hypothetical protein
VTVHFSEVLGNCTFLYAYGLFAEQRSAKIQEAVFQIDVTLLHPEDLEVFGFVFSPGNITDCKEVQSG